MFNLQYIFDAQKRFQDSLNFEITSQEYITNQALCLVNESMEALNETPWKNWKRHQKMNSQKFAEELVDIQLFLINLVMSQDIDAIEFLNMCSFKQQLNVTRKKENY